MINKFTWKRIETGLGPLVLECYQGRSKVAKTVGKFEKHTVWMPINSAGESEDSWPKTSLSPVGGDIVNAVEFKLAHGYWPHCARDCTAEEMAIVSQNKAIMERGSALDQLFEETDDLFWEMSYET